MHFFIYRLSVAHAILFALPWFTECEAKGSRSQQFVWNSTTFPKDTAVVAGGTLILQLRGIVDGSVQWQFDGLNSTSLQFVYSSRPKYKKTAEGYHVDESVRGRYDLWVNNTRLADAGNYTAVVTVNEISSNYSALVSVYTLLVCDRERLPYSCFIEYAGYADPKLGLSQTAEHPGSIECERSDRFKNGAEHKHVCVVPRSCLDCSCYAMLRWNKTGVLVDEEPFYSSDCRFDAKDATTRSTTNSPTTPMQFSGCDVCSSIDAKLDTITCYFGLSIVNLAVQIVVTVIAVILGQFIWIMCRSCWSQRSACPNSTADCCRLLNGDHHQSNAETNNNNNSSATIPMPEPRSSTRNTNTLPTRGRKKKTSKR